MGVSGAVDRGVPACKVPTADLRQRIEGILWRHENGATWRAMPAEYGPWWKPAQTFIDWSRLGVWERLLALRWSSAAGPLKPRRSAISVIESVEPARRLRARAMRRSAM
jgi:transposase